ncbi:MAG: EAL domain-containing protein [Ruminococcus sp.]|jgi:diguanylate cyclase (GGDEF)-like protein/PAS domain S-box-containing protein|nr:EAL domain-containing protein [Ruminococcus sp.]
MRKHLFEIIVALMLFFVTAVFMIVNFYVFNNRADITVAIIIFAILSLGGIVLHTTRHMVSKERDAKARLERLADSINAAVFVWDADFHYRYVNFEFTRLFGYSEDDINNGSDVLHKVLPDDAFMPSLQGIINNRDEEFHVTAKNGNPVAVVWNTSIMEIIEKRDSKLYILMSIGYDLTELLATKQSLEESEKKYAFSMELSEIGILLLQPGDEVFYISEQLRNMISLPEGEIRLKDLQEIIHQKSSGNEFAKISAFVKGFRKTDIEVIQSSRLQVKSSDGSYKWFEFRYRLISSPLSEKFGLGGSVIDISRDVEKDKRIEEMAYNDEITGLYNRNKFMQLGREAFLSTQDSATDYWIIVADIDNFHIVNDTTGYENGNKLLQRMASIVTSQVKRFKGEVARIGGDNFALLVQDFGDDEFPVTIINNIQNMLRDIKSDTFKAQTITCSAGYCKMSDSKIDFSKVLDQAEFSLSLSDGSRESVIRYDNKVHERVLRDAETEKEIAEAITKNEFVLFYQPKINLTDGTLMGMEALIRWIKPDGRLVPPVQFIPIAEKSMNITQISNFVLREACRQNKEWQDKGLPPLTVSVNLTSVDFYQTDVISNIKAVLEETGLAPEYLDIELTESLALKDIDNAVSQMDEINKLGVKLSMDDFGTGYSSLSYIQVLPISLLKLDRSFIMYLEQDEMSKEIVSAVIRIAKCKKIETIAEGVENAAQASILRDSGCDYVQGYLFGKPMPADKFEEFIKAHDPAAAEEIVSPKVAHIA